MFRRPFVGILHYFSSKENRREKPIGKSNHRVPNSNERLKFELREKKRAKERGRKREHINMRRHMVAATKEQKAFAKRMAAAAAVHMLYAT